MPKIQNVNDLSVLECFLRFWDAMRVMEVKIRVLEPRMKPLSTKSAPKLPSAL